MTDHARVKVIKGRPDSNQYDPEEYSGDGIYFWQKDNAAGYDIVKFEDEMITVLYFGILEATVEGLIEDPAPTEPAPLETTELLGLPAEVGEVVSSSLFLKALAVVTDSTALPDLLKGGE